MTLQRATSQRLECTLGSRQPDSTEVSCVWMGVLTENENNIVSSMNFNLVLRLDLFEI